jgi:hypothetical protein
MSKHFFLSALIISSIVIPTTFTRAQTGPELLLRPWQKDERVQTQGDFHLFNEGSTKNSDDFRLTMYDTSGRVRLMPEQRAQPTLGWNYTDFNTSGDPNLPSHLIDTSIGFGMGVADWSGWQAGVTVGLGYAGAGAFDDANAWYGMGDFLIGKKFGKDESLGFGLDFDGNRTYMPDVPIPGFLYTKRIYPQVLVGLGFPVTTIEYKPMDDLRLFALFYFPDDYEVRVDYTVVRNIGIFADWNYRREAFHSDELKNTVDRIIYQTHLVELGVKWSPIEAANLIVAGGYAFNQEFNVGFDTRDQDRIAKPSDEPYLRLGFEVRF